MLTLTLPKPLGLLMAFLSNLIMSVTSSAFKTKTLQRDSKAELTSKEGFSVVAPIKVILPRSTYGKKASCCALLKR